MLFVTFHKHYVITYIYIPSTTSESTITASYHNHLLVSHVTPPSSPLTPLIATTTPTPHTASRQNDLLVSSIIDVLQIINSESFCIVELTDVDLDIDTKDFFHSNLLFVYCSISDGASSGCDSRVGSSRLY